MKVGERTVVGSGVIVTHSGEEIIELDYENLVYRLIFQARSRDSNEPGIFAEIVDGRLDIKLTNFDNPLGTTWYGQVGTVGDKVLFLSVIVHAVGTGTITRSVGYTFSTGVA